MLDGILEDLASRLNELKRQCDEGKKPSATALFDREFLRRLALLSEDDYLRFKYFLEMELFMRGLKLADMPSEQKLDRMVQAKRDEMEREERERPPRRVGDFLADAPDPDLLVPGGWILDPEGLFRAGSDGPGEMAAASPLYAAARLRDSERGREEILLAARVDGEWSRVAAPGSATASQLRQALSSAGVLVADPKAVEKYVFQFRALNGGLIPVREAGDDLDGLFDRFCRYVEEHRQKFEGGLWGRPVDVEGKSCLAVLPERLERFLRGEKAPLRAVLMAWKRLGYLETRGSGLLCPVRFGGRTRRMAVFPRELVLPEEAKAVRA